MRETVLIFFSLFLILVLLMIQILGDGDAIKCPLEVQPEICNLLGPTDFYFAFDSSNGSKLNFFLPLAASMLKKISELNTVNYHRLSMFQAKTGEADLFIDRCAEKTDFDQLYLMAWIPNPKPANVTGVFEMLDRQMRACLRMDFQAIVFVFIYGYSTEKRIRDYLKNFKENMERSIQIYIIYGTELYEKGNLYEILLKDNMIHGCYYLKLPENLISPDIEESAVGLMRCVCYKSEDCHFYDAKKLGKCFFGVENGTEKCVALFGGKVIFQPSQKLRPYSRSCNYIKECEASEIQECVEDCELKKWTGWSQCQLNAKKKIYYRRRERMPNNQSLGQFSDKFCPKWQEIPCPSPITTKPTTRKISTTSRISMIRGIPTTRKTLTTPRISMIRGIPTTRKTLTTPRISTTPEISTTRRISKTPRIYTTHGITTTPKISTTHRISTIRKISTIPNISVTPRIPTTCAPSKRLSTDILPTTDEVTSPASEDSRGVYILVVVVCTAVTIFVITTLICLCTRRKRKTIKANARPHQKPSIYQSKSLSPPASIHSKTQLSEGDGSVQLTGDDGSDMGYLRKTASDISCSKVTKTSELGSPKRINAKRIESNVSIIDKSPTRIAPRKHIEGYIKFSPRPKKL